MIEGDDDVTRPLPRDWLPDAAPPRGAPEWQVRLERIMAAAEPALRQLAQPRVHVAASWSTVFGSWWKPAAAIAAAAAALLPLAPEQPAVLDSGDSALPLGVIAADGDPVALWKSVGIEADPVLALIALQKQVR